jgi:hypothetical protein
MRAAAARFAALANLAVARGQAEPGRPQMADFFEMIEAATAAQPSGPAQIAGALGMVFHGPADGSNDVFEVATARRSRSVDELTGAEMRVERRSGVVGLLILTVDKRVRCIPQQDVVARYGSPKSVIIPRADHPDDAPLYSRYPRPWGELRVGIADGCVTKVVAEFDS